MWWFEVTPNSYLHISAISRGGMGGWRGRYYSLQHD